MDVNHYLLRSLKEKIMTMNIRKHINADISDIIYNSPSGYSELFRSVSDSLSEWQLNVKHLIKVSNWRISRLLMEDGCLRKPEALITMYITTKDNLVMEWYPSISEFRPYNMEETDWLYWDDMQYGNYTAISRLLFIRGFGHYLYDDSYGKAEQYLIEAVKRLIDNIKHFMKDYIDIHIERDLYLEYKDIERMDRQLIGCKIRSVKEYEEEQKEKWLTKTFNDELKVSPTEFLEVFKSTGMKYATTARLLAHKNNTTVTHEKVKKLIYKIYEEYPAVYDAVLSDKAPKDAPPRKMGMVLPFAKQ